MKQAIFIIFTVLMVFSSSCLLHARADYSLSEISVENEQPFKDIAILPRIQDQPQVNLSRNFMRLNWYYGTYGQCIGDTGIEVASHVTPYPEIICGGSRNVYQGNDFWYLLSYDPNQRIYRQVWISEPISDPDAIIKIFHEQLYSLGYDCIAIVTKKGVVQIFDRPSREIIDSFTLQSTELIAACLYDVDSDGDPDLSVIDDDKIMIYDLLSGILMHQFIYSGRDIIAGQFDSDPGAEIAFCDYSDPGYVLDIVTGQIQWTLEDASWSNLEKADVDDDGIDELICMWDWNYIQVLDVDLQQIKWTNSSSSNWDSIKAIDPYSNGQIEIIIGGAQWDKLTSLRGLNGEFLWSIRNLHHSCSEIAFADTDSDGSNEIIWAGGCGSSGPDFLQIAEIYPVEFEWQNLHLDPPFYGLDAADIDQDSRQEIIIASFTRNSGYDNGCLMSFDAMTHHTEYIGEAVPQSHYGQEVQNLTVGNFVEDMPGLEIAIAMSELGDGVVYMYKAPYMDFLWSTEPIEDSILTDLASADVDSDGHLEIVAANEVYSNEGLFMHIINAQTGELKWKSPVLGNGPLKMSGIAIADIDADTNIEIGTAICEDSIVIYDGLTHQLDFQLSMSDISSIAFIDIDTTEPGIEIIIGSISGHLRAYSGITHAVLWTQQPTVRSIDGITGGDVDSTGSKEILIGADGYLLIADSTGHLIWSSKRLGSKAGYYGDILCEDINQDGINEVLIAADLGIFEFTYSNHQLVSQSIFHEHHH